MLRNVLIASTRRAAQLPAARILTPRPTSAYTHPTCRSYTVLSRRIAPLASSKYLRWSSSSAGLNRTEVEGRIMDLLKNFDRVTDATKITATSNFSKDLGLDSLDSVEVVMAIEEEFGIEIPDKEADAIQSVDQGVDYILKQPEAH